MATNPIRQFSTAAPGWYAAVAQAQEQAIVIVPIVAWAVLADDSPRATAGRHDLEPVVLWDNTREPIVAPLGPALADWGDGSYLHQVLAPGAQLRKVPEGWSVKDYQG